VRLRIDPDLRAFVEDSATREGVSVGDWILGRIRAFHVVSAMYQRSTCPQCDGVGNVRRGTGYPLRCIACDGTGKVSAAEHTLTVAPK